jgi:Fe-S oxidoreductase
MSWKDTLDLYSCTECGRCQALCPAWNTEKPLSPKNLIVDLKKNLHLNKTAILEKKAENITHISHILSFTQEKSSRHHKISP